MYLLFIVILLVVAGLVVARLASRRGPSGTPQVDGPPPSPGSPRRPDGA